MSSILPQSPWAVSSGLYIRTDGEVIYLSGLSDFWNKEDTVDANDEASMKCEAGSSTVGGKQDTPNQDGSTKEKAVECQP